MTRLPSVRMEIEMSRLQLKGYGSPSIAYELEGKGTQSLVFIHGLTYNRHMWEPVIEKLSSSYTCLNIDLPGHGDSYDASSYDLFVVAGYIDELVNNVGLHRPVVVGHSLGGAIAGMFSGIYPASGLVTSDVELLPTTFFTFLHKMRDQLQGPAFPQVWRSIESQLRIDLIPDERRGLVQGKNSNPRQEIFLGYQKQVLTVPPREIVKQIDEYVRQKIPTSFPITAIFGSDVNGDYRDWVSSAIPQCRLVEFPNAGHFPHLVDPDRFASEIQLLAQRARFP